MPITLKTKRWDDPVEPGDGYRLLITRYRPRGLKKELENWNEWNKDLAPRSALLAAYHGKSGLKANWQTYRRRYLLEMAGQKSRISALAQRLKDGETITLLCSSACVKESRCHRSLLAELVEQALAESEPKTSTPGS